MSRPRKPYGDSPGRLPATMIKVLAAELSDQGRLARGKRYWADDAVTEIMIGHGVVTAEIQGSRPDPYVVTMIASPGNGVPGKRELRLRCTCPDDGIYEACKHAVAALFALSDEVALEPQLLDRWRGGSTPSAESATDDTEPAKPSRQSGLAEVVPIRRPPTSDPAPPEPRRAAPVADPLVDEIARLLVAPAARPAPMPEVTPIEHTGLRDRQLAELFDDALDHLAINWE